MPTAVGGGNKEEPWATPWKRRRKLPEYFREKRNNVPGGGQCLPRRRGNGQVSAGRGRGVPGHQPGLELDAERLEKPVLELAQQQADGGPAELGERLADRRQGRDGDRGLGGVVEPDDRQVVRNPQATGGRRLHRADRHAVVEREDRGRRV